MRIKHKFLTRRKLAASLSAGVVAAGLATGGYAVASSGSGSSASSTASSAQGGKVIPFHRGQPSPSKVVGQVPANWSPGSGTIVTGASANEAKSAAVAAYPGGIVDRVVRVSNGDYNVHIIGVNWPHHVFVSRDFRVIGAE
jgi:hypothetical protein